MGAFSEETIKSVRHYTDRLFSFRVTRPQSLRFRSGEFVMIGLKVDGKPLLRAYSIASPSWDEELEFYSIKVPDGPLTSKLQHVSEGDTILLGTKPVGTLVLDALLPGKRLYLLSTGTGIAPFASVIRDPETYERYDQVILAHTCREVAELTYGRELVDAAREDPLVGEFVGDKLVYYPSVTRDDFERKGRITTLMDEGVIYDELGIPPLNPETDRVMICGSMEMLEDCKLRCEQAGLTEGSNARPGEFVIEKAFAV